MSDLMSQEMQETDMRKGGREDYMGQVWEGKGEGVM